MGEEGKDYSELSFNLLLSPPTSFEGGGTGFLTAPATARDGADIEGEDEAEVMVARPERGEMLSHFGQLLHAGQPVVSGTRYILAGFVAVESLASRWRELRPQ